MIKLYKLLSFLIKLEFENTAWTIRMKAVVSTIFLHENTIISLLSQKQEAEKLGPYLENIHLFVHQSVKQKTLCRKSKL